MKKKYNFKFPLKIYLYDDDGASFVEEKWFSCSAISEYLVDTFEITKKRILSEKLYDLQVGEME